MEVFLHGHDYLHFQPFSPLWRMRSGAEDYRLSNQGLVSLAMSPHPTSIQEPTESHSCRATEGKKKDVPSVLIT